MSDESLTRSTCARRNIRATIQSSERRLNLGQETFTRSFITYNNINFTEFLNRRYQERVIFFFFLSLSISNRRDCRLEWTGVERFSERRVVGFASQKREATPGRE